MYMEMASYYINSDHYGGFEILCHLCEFGSLKSRTDDIPGWVPDWSTRRQQPLPDMTVQELQSLVPPDRSRQERRHREIMTMEHFFGRSSRSDPQSQEALDWFKSRDFISTSIHTSRQRLRINYNPLAFLDRGGIVDRVICPSTAPDFWQELHAALEQSPKSAETWLPHQESLLFFLADMLANRNRAAGEPSRRLASYMEEIGEGVQAHGVNPDALSAAHKMVIQDISSSLRHSAILDIQTMAGSYWATGPLNSQVGDWVVPMQFRGLYYPVPIMCLRSINLTKAEEPQQISQATGMGERCLRFFSAGNIAEVSCLHLTARFVGPASHCDERRFEPSEGDKEEMLEVIMQANKVASGKGLPGPIVFDVV